MDGFKVPTISVSGEKKKYKQKTKEIDMPQSKMLSEESKINLIYYEVKSQLSPGAIAGIAIACVVVVAAIAVGVFFLVKKQKGAAKVSGDEP